ncbi:MAG: hypothetical protein WCQ53_04845 [bacterium]
MKKLIGLIALFFIVISSQAFADPAKTVAITIEDNAAVRSDHISAKMTEHMVKKGFSMLDDSSKSDYILDISQVSLDMTDQSVYGERWGAKYSVSFVLSLTEATSTAIVAYAIVEDHGTTIDAISDVAKDKIIDKAISKKLVDFDVSLVKIVK